MKYFGQDNRFPSENRIGPPPHLRFRSVTGWAKSHSMKCVNGALSPEVKRHLYEAHHSSTPSVDLAGPLVPVRREF
jgi:hypothetical protein